MDNSSYRYKGKVAIPTLSSLAASSVKYTTSPLKKTKSCTSDENASESEKSVQNVNISSEGSEIDTNPSSINKVNGALKESAPLTDLYPPIGDSENCVEAPSTSSGVVTSSIGGDRKLKSKQSISAVESAENMLRESNVPTSKSASTSADTNAASDANILPASLDLDEATTEGC